ncbi:glycerophosphodiester phosphodiesterase family protein [Leucothrix mucor]|uniref:glycerophosphodiester phosphodiesterase family protein n=1 Tax=Leucothrix mucor TaxID=45248 RepID=UPI0003B3FB42|nr:glycerophosphodiester phosphodiesterase family protein [Leucothrix mucor]
MKPLIIAHRGNNFSFPENSLNGLRSSFELGCMAVEFDIQMMADKNLVILHDPNTLRTSGQDHSIFELTKEKLKDLSIYDPKRLGDTHIGTPLSLLSEFFPILEEFPQGHAYVEVKYESLKQWGRQELLDELLPMLTPYAKQCTVISFDIKVLEMIREQSGLSIGWVLNEHDEATKQTAEMVKPEYLIIDQAEMPLTEAPWAGSWKWMVYGVKSADLAFQHYENGVEYVETDFLPRLLADPRLKPE